MSEMLARYTPEELSGVFRNWKATGQDQFIASCPCIGHAHGDAHPSLCITSQNGKWLFRCMSQNHTFDEICTSAGLKAERCFANSAADAVHQAQPFGLTLERYAAEKALDKGLLAKFGVVEIPFETKKGQIMPAVLFQHWDENGKPIRNRIRAGLASQKMKPFPAPMKCPYREGTPEYAQAKANFNRDFPILPYGLWLLKDFQQESIVLVEGESDCHSLWSGNFAALGIPGATLYKEEWSRYILPFARVYLSSEGDSANAEFLHKVCANPEIAQKAFIVQWHTTEGEPAKDPNELLQKAKGDLDIFRASINSSFQTATPFSAFDFPISDKQGSKEKTEAKKDRRSETSKGNGLLGGRPASDFIGVCREMLNETENSKDFAEDCLQDFRLQGKQVFHWVGNCYKEITMPDFEAIVMDKIQQFYASGKLADYGIKSTGASTLHSTITNLRSRSFLALPSDIRNNSFFQISEKGITFDPEDHKIYLPVHNGILDLETAALEFFRNGSRREQIDTSKFFFPCQRTFFNKRALDVSFDVNAQAPTFEASVKFLLNDDASSISSLYDMYGLALTPNRTSNVFFCLYGKGGTGKTSVGMLPLQFLFGTGNYGTLDWSRFNDKDGRFEMAKLAEYTLNATDETADLGNGKDNSSNIATLKRITCGQTITAEKKGIDSKDVYVTALVVFATNRLDFLKSITIQDKALLDRLRLIKFNKQVRGTDIEDPLLPTRLKQETPGILNIALQALGKIMMNKYKVEQSAEGSKKIASLLEETRTGVDRFLYGYILDQAAPETTITELHTEYRKFLAVQGYDTTRYLKRPSFISTICEYFDTTVKPALDYSEDYITLRKKTPQDFATI